MQLIVSSIMPYHKRRYSPGQLQFINTSTCRPAPLFLSDRCRRCFVETLAQTRQETKFLLQDAPILEMDRLG